MDILTVTKDNFDAEVLKSEKPVLIDFWAEWCGPCKRLAPVIHEIAGERDDIVVGKIDVDEQPELAAQYNVMSIPTLFMMMNGKPVGMMVGLQPKEAVNALIEAALEKKA